MCETILYYHCFAGISGDMHLAALLGLGLPEAHLRSELKKLPLHGEYSLRISEDSKMGIYGLKVEVDTDENHGEPSHLRNHHHRDYKSIIKLIEHSKLDENTKKRSLHIFDVIARAEAKIHNQTVESVHFHEVGAVDSIVDIVGAAIGIEYLVNSLGITKIVSSKIELGGGDIQCAHGTYPIPAPATLEILKGVPVSSHGVQHEATTPTGAAILKACVDEFIDQIDGAIDTTAYGIGHRDADLPNVLRAHIIKRQSQSLSLNPGALNVSSHVKIEANIDDMSPEAFEPLYLALLEVGADDVFLHNIVMKKTRPAYMVSILCRAGKLDAVCECLFNQSSTIGLRIFPFAKRALPRETKVFTTSLGHVPVKLVKQPNGLPRWKSEHDDIVKLAHLSGEPYLSCKKQIDQEIREQLEPKSFSKNFAQVERTESV